jgi:hypothetical protein
VNAPGRAPGLSFYTILAVVYASALAVATYPMVLHLGTMLPSMADPIQHLWVMRWYLACLTNGQSPLLCTGIQYPTGVEIGLFSPLILQSALFGLIKPFAHNDILTYNLIALIGFVGTGLSTFALAYHFVADRASASLAGLLAMLSGPMMIHGFGHLDIVFLAGIPLFYLAWIRFVDDPTGRTLLHAVLALTLCASCNAYFVHLAFVPAVAYLAWAIATVPNRERRAWLLRRTGWMLAIAAVSIPPVVLLSFGPAHAVFSGATSDLALRSRLHESELYDAPLWSYLTPTPFHALGQLLPFSVYAAAGHSATIVERSSYLGIVTIALIYRAAVQGTCLPRKRFWWFLLGLLVALGMGATITIGSHALTATPARLLWHLPNFRFLRYPARFNLLVVPVAALIAAASFRDVSARFSHARYRWAAVAALALVALADQSMVPFALRYQPAPLPRSYMDLVRRDPSATFVEAPTGNSALADPLTALASYWQSIHHARTTAGYSGCPNQVFDDRVVYGSPFSLWNMNRPGYPSAIESYDLVRNVRFADYAWLYLHANDLRFAMLHRTAGGARTIGSASIDRISEFLPGSKVGEDGPIVVLDRDRMATPRDPVAYCLAGWERRPFWSAPSGARVRDRADLALYLPDRAEPGLRLDLSARCRRGPVRLRLRTQSGQVVGESLIDGLELTTVTFPLDHLPAGLQTLSLEVSSAASDSRAEIHAESLELQSPAIARRADEGAALR